MYFSLLDDTYPHLFLGISFFQFLVIVLNV